VLAAEIIHLSGLLASLKQGATVLHKFQGMIMLNHNSSTDDTTANQAIGFVNHKRPLSLWSWHSSIYASMKMNNLNVTDFLRQITEYRSFQNG